MTVAAGNVTAREGEFVFRVTREAGYFRLSICNLHRMQTASLALTPAEYEALAGLLRDPWHEK